MYRSTLKTARTVAGLWIAFGLFAVDGALAQSPTPEGTTIRNIAEVDWTDV